LKLALISDTHFGVKKSDKTFLENQLKFFYREFIPYLKENDIDTVAILGDLFDTRNSLNTYMKTEVFTLFETFAKENIKIYIFMGNHDIYFRNTNQIHSLTFLKKFDNVTLVEDVELFDIGGKKLLFVAWQVDNEQFKERIANKNIHCDVCLGHFDIVGFPYNNNSVCHEGIETNIFLNNYTLTFSGHFHKRTVYKVKDRDIVMIGSPYQLNRGDKGNERGFCVLDLDDLSYNFVNTKETIKFIDLKYPETFNKNLICNNVIDIHVDYNSETLDSEIQNYVSNIEKFSPAYPPNIFVNNTLFDNIDKDSYEVKSLADMITEFVDKLEIDNKSEITEILNELYAKSKGEA
jgi:DNA repair exonuclease SbcCD nuclease subunit